jgi:WD40 repeat protein
VDIESGKAIRRLIGPNNPSEAGAQNAPSNFIFSRTGRLLFVSFLFPHINPKICSYDVESWTQRACWASQMGADVMVAGKEERTLITANARGNVQFWNTETGKVVHEFAASSVALRSMALNPTGTILATGEGDRAFTQGSVVGTLVQKGEDDSIRLWHADSGTLMSSFHATAPISSIAFSQSGHYFVAPSRIDHSGTEVSLFDTKSAKKLATIVSVEGALLGVRFNGNGKRLAVVAGNSVLIYSYDEE